MVWSFADLGPFPHKSWFLILINKIIPKWSFCVYLGCSVFTCVCWSETLKRAKKMRKLGSFERRGNTFSQHCIWAPEFFCSAASVQLFPVRHEGIDGPATEVCGEEPRVDVFAAPRSSLSTVRNPVGDVPRWTKMACPHCANHWCFQFCHFTFV